MDQVQYWDVFPKSIKVSQSDIPVTVPLSVRGAPRGAVEFESASPGIASVDEVGRVTLGGLAGATQIMAYESADRQSVRYVQIDVVDYGTGGVIEPT